MTTEQALNTAKLEAGEIILSRNPDKAMQEMMHILDALRTVYVEENEALMAANTSAFLALQEKKFEAAKNYQAGAEQLIKRKDEFKAIAPSLRQKLYEKHEEFTSLTSTNLNALNRMRTSVRRLGERIMDVAREAASKETPNYGSSGSLNKNERCLTIGVNESA